MNKNTTLFSDARSENKVLITGLILLAISAILFYTNTFEALRNTDFFNSSFVVSGLIFLVYFIIVCISNLSKYGKRLRFKNLKYNIILLQLANISAYALNRVIPVFHESTDWLCAYLVLIHTALIVFALKENYKPTWLNHLILLLTASGFVFHLYQTIYVFPFYPLGLFVFWFFGISLHVFVPLWAFVTSIIVIRKYLKASPDYWKTTLIGVLTPLLLLGIFMLKWNNINHHIQERFHSQNMPLDEKELPGWVEISRDIPSDWISKKVLKSEIFYNTGEIWDGDFLPFGRMNLDKMHDPFVVVTSLVFGKLDIAMNDRLNILNSMYDLRHQTERKLWSGDALSTTDIVTNVQLFPEYRLAYTEKTFKIHNQLNTKWRNQQEALYTFYLPEGSVVTSASLWVEGTERPAYLTTKTKADSAYTRIVGRERRDPLLLHWQEGNRVTVRVFPCTPQEDRQFKIGITTPLRIENDKLVYENVDFQGPDWKLAEESINVVYEGNLGELSAPFSFKERGSSWTYRGKYKSDWTLKFDAVPISKNDFTFNGKRYDMKAWQSELTTFKAQEIYLDINDGWSKKETRQIWENIKNRNVYVYTNHLEKVSEQNHKRLFNSLLQRKFSVFPFHKIKSPEAALVITKSGTRLTPVLDDMKKSTFAQSLNTFLKTNDTNIKLYNLDQAISPYLRSLKELRTLNFVSGDMKQLMYFLGDDKFADNREDDNAIINHYSKTILSETMSKTADSTARGAAPDHLMRMYVYNDLMKQVGREYFDKKMLEKQYIAAAKEAYVVTPVSSLVVLETQADYDRFNIKKAKNSLQNAKIKASGSVPEPGEWLLVILSLLVAIILVLKSKNETVTAQ